MQGEKDDDGVGDKQGEKEAVKKARTSMARRRTGTGMSRARRRP